MMRQERRAVLGDTSVMYTLRRSRRAKHILLHVDHDGEVELVVPWHAAYTQAERFLQEKQTWLLKRIAAGRQRQVLRPRRVLVSGESIPLFDTQLRLAVTSDERRQRSRVVRRDDTLFVLVRRATDIRPALIAWYRRQARHYFTEQATALAAQVGVTVRSVRIGAHKTQWGSCGPHGQLSFNWRLLLGPEFVARYVVVHEVVHIKHHNHSRVYWNVVRRFDPQYEQARRWLRHHGHGLVL